MERSDTLTLFSEISEIGPFEGLLQETSFNERFNTKDFRDILSSSDEQSTSPMDVWKHLDNDSNSIEDDKIENYATKSNNIEDVQIENYATESNSIEDVKIENYATIPANKKIIEVGDSIYLYNAEDEVLMLKEENGQFKRESVVVINENNETTPIMGSPSLSLQPWIGDFNFSVQVETSTYSNTKWAYSKVLQKLFLRPFDAAPIEVTVSQWFDGYINITPVFTASQHHSQPVKRCHNHKLVDQEKNLPYFEHIVQVDNTDANYRLNDSRYSVDIPLGTPAPGERTKLLYVKCGCWNTCTGGPSRKPFCLVFTLFSSFGEELGRQILDLKVCACPVRDRGYSERSHLSKLHPGKDSGKKLSVVRKKASGTKKIVKRIKAEPQEERYELISVPSELAGDVKRFVNQLVAEKYAKENSLTLPFPDN